MSESKAPVVMEEKKKEKEDEGLQACKTIEQFWGRYRLNPVLLGSMEAMRRYRSPSL